MILSRLSSRFHARSSWGLVLPRRSIRLFPGWGISRTNRRLGCWLWGFLAVGRYQHVFKSIGS